MKKLWWWIVLIVLAAIALGGWWFLSAPTAEAPVPTVTNEAVDGGLTVATATETAQLAAIEPYTGSGVATRSFDGTLFTHTVDAVLGAPAAGTFYEGWLVMPTAAGPQFFSTGKLEPGGSGYVLTYTAPQNYPDHTMVVITEETAANGLDNKPEAHVLEGSF